MATFSGFRLPGGPRFELDFRCLTSSSDMSPRKPSSDTKSLEDKKNKNQKALFSHHSDMCITHIKLSFMLKKKRKKGAKTSIHRMDYREHTDKDFINLCVSVTEPNCKTL